MRLTDAEKAILDGSEGRAKAKAMELLVRYGEALGAERLVETKNVAGTWAVSPFMKDFVARGMDAVYSEFDIVECKVATRISREPREIRQDAGTAANVERCRRARPGRVAGYASEGCDGRPCPPGAPDSS